MNRLATICHGLRDQGQRPLVPYVTAGFPDVDTSQALLQGCIRRGCRVVEVGVPFSDPVADGPVIQRTSQVALDGGMTLDRALHLVGELAGDGLAPVMMTYLNPILRLGLPEFAARAERAGCTGVIVPDLSHEESPELRRALADRGLTLVDLAAPTSPDQRLRRLAADARGFLYLVAVAGVTGTRSAAAGELAEFAARARRLTDTPLYVGFGIDGAERARQAAAVADGVIVGSALLRPFLDRDHPADGLDAALALVDDLLAALAPGDRRIPS